MTFVFTGGKPPPFPNNNGQQQTQQQPAAAAAAAPAAAPAPFQQQQPAAAASAPAPFQQPSSTFQQMAWLPSPSASAATNTSAAFIPTSPPPSPGGMFFSARAPPSSTRDNTGDHTEEQMGQVVAALQQQLKKWGPKGRRTRGYRYEESSNSSLDFPLQVADLPTPVYVFRNGRVVAPDTEHGNHHIAKHDSARRLVLFLSQHCKDDSDDDDIDADDVMDSYLSNLSQLQCTVDQIVHGTLGLGDKKWMGTFFAVQVTRLRNDPEYEEQVKKFLYEIIPAVKSNDQYIMGRFKKYAEDQATRLAELEIKQEASKGLFDPTPTPDKYHELAMSAQKTAQKFGEVAMEDKKVQAKREQVAIEDKKLQTEDKKLQAQREKQHHEREMLMLNHVLSPKKHGRDDHDVDHDVESNSTRRTIKRRRRVNPTIQDSSSGPAATNGTATGDSGSRDTVPPIAQDDGVPFDDSEISL